MSNLGLRGKIFAIIVFILIIFSMGMTYDIYIIRDEGEIVLDMYQHPFTVTRNVLEFKAAIFEIHRDMKDIVLSNTPEEIESFAKKIFKAQEAVFKNIAVIQERILGEQGRELIDKAKALFIAWEPFRNQTIDLIKKGQKEEAVSRTRSKGAQYAETIIASVDAIKDYAYTRATEFKENADKKLKQSTIISICILVVFAIVSLIIGFFFARSLINPILLAVQNLNSASSEILAAVQQQSASTKEQAAAVQQTTTTMEEINQTGVQMSTRAKEIVAASESTSSGSISGLTAVNETNQTMETIREQVEQVAENIVYLSEKAQVIGEIISTVNDIAEQSNLLSLNAAIEAVGAGEQGQRFSVVASEMKNLADQAKVSTIQVRSILSDVQKGINTSVMSTEETVKRVEAGKSKSGSAAESIRSLTDAIQRSVQAFQQIVAGINQQGIGMQQVTEALKQIRQATEQTSSGTNQIEKAIKNLADLSLQLKNLVVKS